MAMTDGWMKDLFFPVPTMGRDFFSRYLTTSSTLLSESRLMMIQIILFSTGARSPWIVVLVGWLRASRAFSLGMRSGLEV